MRYAVVNSDRKVVNVIEAPEDWTVARGLSLIVSNQAGPGDTWDGANFIRSEPLPEDPDPVNATVDELVTEIDKVFQARTVALTVTEKGLLRGKFLDLIGQGR